MRADDMHVVSTDVFGFRDEEICSGRCVRMPSSSGCITHQYNERTTADDGRFNAYTGGEAGYADAHADAEQAQGRRGL